MESDGPMFVKLGPNTVKHVSAGHIVQIVGRYELKYTENDRSIRIEIDDESDPMLIYCGSIHSWLPPFEGGEISDEYKGEIKRAIGEALDFLGVRYEFA